MVNEKTRVKALKKQILEDLNLQEMCAIRLYANGELILSDMDFVKDLEIQKVEAEVFFTINIQVAGMGPQYKKQFDVSPNDTLDQIREKTTFYQLFTQRNYTLETDGGITIERDKLSTTYFRDSGLRNGSNIFMRPPIREHQRTTAED